MEVGDFVILLVLVVSFVVTIVIDIIIITLKPSEELPKKIQQSKLKTVKVSDFVILVVIAVTAIIFITLEPSMEHPKAVIWEFLERFQSDDNDSKDNKRDNKDNNTSWYYYKISP